MSPGHILGNFMTLAKIKALVKWSSVKKKNPEKLSPPKNWLPKVYQNLAINSWDIADMDKCCQNICCLDKCYRYSWHLLKIVKGSHFYSFVKIGSVKVQIFLIRTNVTWTNVVRTNVTDTIGICSRCSQEPTFKISSKSGQ